MTTADATRAAPERNATATPSADPGRLSIVDVARSCTVGTPKDLSIGRYSRAGEMVKAVTDRVLAAAGLLLVAPVLVVVAVAIRLDSRGPALFRQTRIGRDGRPFTFYKFRGMFVDARERWPDMYAYRYSEEELRDFHFHPQQDPRVTRVGRFIRRTSLDELPNLLNVVLGDMSLVGPRPEIPEMLPYYGAHASEVLSVKPGVTSVAKLVGRDHLNFSQTLALDVRYVRERCLRLDFKVIVGTVCLVVTGKSIGF